MSRHRAQDGAAAVYGLGYAALVAGWLLLGELVLQVLVRDERAGQEHSGAAYVIIAVTGALVAAVIWRDVTARRHTGSALAASLKSIDAIRLVTDPELADRPLEELLGELTARISQALGVDSATFFLLDDDGGELQATASHGLDDLVRSGFRVGIGTGIVGRVAAYNQPMVVADVRESSVADALKDRVASMVGCPLAVQGRVIGVLHVGTVEPRLFTDADVRVLQLVADRAAVEVERGRLGNAARRSRLGAEHARRHLTLLANASAVLATSLDAYEDALQQLADVIVPAFADWCAIDLLAQDGEGELRRVAVRHVDTRLAADAEDPSEDFPDHAVPIHRVLRTGRSELTRNVRRLPPDTDGADDDHVALCRYLRLDSVMIVPIKVRGLSIGAISFGTLPSRRGFRPSDQSAAEDVAGRAAVAIERVLLYIGARDAAHSQARYAAQLRRLMEAALAVGAPLSKPDVLHIVAVQARRVVGAGRALVVLDGAGDGDDVRVASPLDEGEHFPGIDRDVADATWLSAPLVGPEGHRRGRVHLADKHEGTFTAEDESILVSLAQMASVALENAELYGAVETSEQRLQALVEASPLAILELGFEGRVVWSNRAAREILGWDDAIPSRLRVPDGSAGSRGVSRMIDAVQAGEATLNVDLAVTKPDGTPVDLSISTAPLLDNQGNVRAALVVAADVTERKQVAGQLQQAQRMEAMGRLAGGVAHDFNNLLTVIVGYADLLARQLGDDSPLRPDLDAIRKAGERAAALTGQLLTISRRQVVQPVELDPSSVVASLEEVLRRVVGEHVSLELSIGTDAQVTIDPAQLEQVLLNLVINARDAMPDGGQVVIATSAVDVAAAQLPDQLDLEPGRYVLVSVADTGTGMDADTLAQCFEPFFTTKGRTKGTGLGLSTAYGVVTQAGGFVTVDSTVGRGTTFRLHLPVARASAAASSSKPPRRAAGGRRSAKGGSEVVLLVEDEAEVRSLAADVLAGAGYRVLVAAGADDAVALADGEPVELLVTDVVMPGTNGVELADRLVTERPGLAVLFISGYVEDVAGPRGLIGEGADLLAKPFHPEELVRRVRRALDQRPKPARPARARTGTRRRARS